MIAARLSSKRVLTGVPNRAVRVLLAFRRQEQALLLKTCKERQVLPQVVLRRSFSTSLTPQGEQGLAKTSADGVVGLPIDFDVSSKIEGKESQVGCFFFSSFLLLSEQLNFHYYPYCIVLLTSWSNTRS